MITLLKWKARRSGGRMTVEGTDVKGDPMKITSVDEIALKPSGTIVAIKAEREVAILRAA